MNKVKSKAKKTSSKRTKDSPKKATSTVESLQDKQESSIASKILKLWKTQNVYAFNEKTSERTTYVIREMPTPVDTLNVDTLRRKIYQDIFLKTEMMRGHTVAYTPLWETFPFSVEAHIIKENISSAANIINFRRQCRQIYGKRLKKQQQKLKNLGIFADWSSSDRTMDSRHETKLFSFFDRLRDSKYLKDELRLSHWCPNCFSPLETGKTAIPLTKSIAFTYVKFPFSSGFEEFGTDVYFAVHLPISQLWKIAGTIAIGIYEKVPFWLTKYEKQYIIFSEPQLKKFAHPNSKRTELPEPIAKLNPSKLRDCSLTHPLFSLTDLRFVIIPEAVNASLEEKSEKNEMLSGIIPLNPAHHSLSYTICKTMPEIGNFINEQFVSSSSIIPIFDETGRFTEETDILCGLNLFNAIQFISDELETRECLINARNEKKQQLHCQHCNNTSVSRPYRHWFFSNPSPNVLREVSTSQDYWDHYPEDIQTPIQNEIRNINDMPISSQRQWGVPLPVLRCDNCNDLITDKKILRAVRSSIRRGSEHWFRLSVEELLPTDTVCVNCHSKDFRKESTYIESDFSNLLQTLDSSDFKTPILDSSRNVIFLPKTTFLKWLGELSILSAAMQLSRPSKESQPFKHIMLHHIAEHVWETEVLEEHIQEYPADVIRHVSILPDIHEVPIKGNGKQQLEALIKEYYNKYGQLKDALYQAANFLKDLKKRTGSDKHRTLADENEDDRTSILLEQDKLAISVTREHIQQIEAYYEVSDYAKIWQLLFDFCQSELLFYIDLSKTEITDENVDSKYITVSSMLTAILQRLAPIQPFLAEEIHGETHSTSSIFKNRLFDFSHINTQGDTKSRWESLKKTHQTKHK